MQAIVVEKPGNPEVIQLKELTVPSPGEGQIRIQVAYSALNPLDTHSRAGRVAWNAPKMPYTPGYEYTGRVDLAGNGVDKSLIGKRVSVAGEWGGNAEYTVVPASKVRLVPDEFSWQIAACFATCGPTSWHLIHSAGKVKSGQRVIIHSAAGAVGALTTQIAKDVGAEVFGLVGSEDRKEYAKQFGADYLINRNSCDWAEEFLSLTEKKGADLIIDGVAGSDSPLNYKAIAPLGNIIYLGLMGGPPPDVNISQIIGKSFSVTGFVQYFHQAQSKGAEMIPLTKNLSNGSWIIPIGHIGSLNEVSHLHRLFESRSLAGRTLIKIGGEI